VRWASGRLPTDGCGFDGILRGAMGKAPVHCVACIRKPFMFDNDLASAYTHDALVVSRFPPRVTAFSSPFLDVPVDCSCP
jgi:hypothetical protein